MAKVICTELQKDGASGPNITLDTSKNVTCENNLTVDGTTTLTGTVTGDNDTLSNRNVIYNGAMQIYQRGQVTGVGATNGSTYSLDRWQVYTQNTASRYTISQDTESPDGFGHSMRVDCTTADTSLAANEEVLIQQKIEGFDVQRFQKGTSGAKAYTLSFWAKSDKTGTYICRLLGRDNTTSNVSKAYTVANTNWNKYTLNFPADTDTNRKDSADSGESLRVCWWLVAGSGVNTGTLQETWANSSDSGAATGQVNFADSDSNDFWLTGVQLETGSTGSEFEHRTYGDELMRCYRYFYMHASGADSSWQNIGLLSAWTSSQENCLFPFPTRMRTTPSLYKVVGTDYFRCARNNGYQDSDDVGFDANGGSMMGFLTFTDDIASSGGYAGYAQIVDGKTAARIGFDAEL